MSLNSYNRVSNQMGSLAAGCQGPGFDSKPGSPTCEGLYLKPMKNPILPPPLPRVRGDRLWFIHLSPLSSSSHSPSNQTRPSLSPSTAPRALRKKPWSHLL